MYAEWTATSPRASTPALAHLHESLAAIEHQWNSLPQPQCEGLDGLFGAPSLQVPSALLSATHAAHDTLTRILSSCMPPPEPVARRLQGRTASAWHACILELRRVKRAILDDAQASGRLRPHCISLSNLADSWAKATGMDSHHRAQHMHTPPCQAGTPSCLTLPPGHAAWVLPLILLSKCRKSPASPLRMLACRRSHRTSFGALFFLGTAPLRNV